MAALATRLTGWSWSLGVASRLLSRVPLEAPGGTTAVLIEAPVVPCVVPLEVAEPIGDAPYLGPLLLRPPNKRRKWQGLEEPVDGDRQNLSLAISLRG
eukprot:Skav234831  [mRNA]  locus=scaffold69:1153478:1154124:- [translate_table: standard]